MPTLTITALNTQEIINNMDSIKAKLELGYYQGQDFNADWDLQEDE